MTLKTISLAGATILLAALTIWPASTANSFPVSKKTHEHHAGYVKPGAAIDLAHNYDGETQKGEIENFEITLTHMYSEGYLTVSLMADTALNVSSDMTAQHIKLASNSNLKIPVQLTSMTAGTHSLSVETIYENLKGEQSRRILSLPIDVDQPLKGKHLQAKTQKTQPSGGLITLTAREVIK